jgi:hypothetical protein
VRSQIEDQGLGTVAIRNDQPGLLAYTGSVSVSQRQAIDQHGAPGDVHVSMSAIRYRQCLQLGAVEKASVDTHILVDAQ